jgi:hypothetical protein
MDAPLDPSQNCDQNSKTYHQYALLSSRIDGLEELNELLTIEYLQGNTTFSKAEVKLSFCSEFGLIYSELMEGLSQDEVMKARKAGISEKIKVLFAEPSLVQNRKHLKDIYLLSRRRHDVYGYRDVAFYDLALEASRKIGVDESAYRFERDSSEKGYINTFNHITAQAIISSIYSRELADLIADVHERYNMPELIRGDFSADQLNSLDNNPVDNYVDIINNEIGQLIGHQLKEKYKIKLHQQWTEKLLCQYLNDLQVFYSRAFKVKLMPFHKDEEVIIRFCEKLNSYYKTNYQSRSS